MARNGSGTMTLSSVGPDGQTILAAEHNTNYTDIAAELTNSVAKDGQTTMTGTLKAANGTVSLPAYTFGSDTNTGLYRIGADNIGITIGGTKIVDISSTGAIIVGIGTVTSLAAASDDGGALGASGTAFSDLFLASGGVINWNAGDITLTHSSNLLTLGGGDLSIGTTAVLTAGTIELGHASDTTLARSGAGDVSIEGNAIYRAGGTDVPVTDGGTGASTAAGARTNLAVAYASQANMEAEASGVVPEPASVKWHPGVVKAHCRVASDGTLQSGSYGITSTAKTATGTYEVTLAGTMGDTNYTPHATVNQAGRIAATANTSTTVVTVTTTNSGSSAAQDSAFSFSLMGDLA